MKKRLLSILLSVCMVISLLPAMAVTVSAAEHSHDGWTAVTMGETHIKLGDAEQTSNTLTAGNYYLDGDLTLAGPLYIGDGTYGGGMVTLCLNGKSITTSNTSTDSSGAAIYMKDETKLTIVDCGATSGTVTGNSYGIYMYDDGTLYISGGTITGGTYGIYNCSPSWNKIYLSGSPTISGTTAGIYNSSSPSYIYADDGAAENSIAYSGSAISLAYYSMYSGNTAVRNVADSSKFTLKDDSGHYELVYDDSAKTFKIQGKPQTLTWYAEDGTTPLSGDSYPSSGNFGETISPLPTYTAAEGYRFNGWLYRTSGSSSWSNYRWSAFSQISGNMEFKADVVQVYNITVTDGSNLSFTVNSSAVTQAAKNDCVYIASGSEDYYLQGVTVAKASGASVTVSHSDYYGYYFTMPDEAVNVTATLVPVTRSGARVYTADNGDVFLGGDYIELGLRPSGVFGTATNAPTSGTLIFHPNSKQSNSAIGLRSNGNQTWSEGLATGNDETVDFFLPGTIDEGWIVGWSATESEKASMQGRAQAAGSGYSDTIAAGSSVAVTTGTNAESGKTTLTAVTTATVASTVGVEQTVSFDADGKYFTTSVTLTNHGGSTLYDLSYIRAFDPDQRSGASSSPSSAYTDNYFYKDSQGNIWVIAFGNNSLDVGSYPTAVSFADMVVNNTAAITPFVFCAKPGDGYTVQAVNTVVGWESYSNFYRGSSSSYQAGDDLYGKHYYADKGIGLEFIVASLGAGQSVTFSWVSSLDTDVLKTIENVRDEIGVVPPAIDSVTLSLSANVDAQGGNKKIDVSAKVKDAAGVDDSLYYSYKPADGDESDKVLIDTVAADGSEQSLSGAIDLSSFANGTYTFYFWVSNSEGVTSDKVTKTITVSDTGLSGDLETPATYTVTYDLNGGEGTTPTAQTQAVGAAFTTAAQGSITKTGYTFGGWSTASGGTKDYDANASVSGISTNITLYAVWTANAYTVTFKPNYEGAETADVTQNFVYGTPQALTANSFTRTGYYFAGWAASSDGSVIYSDRQEVQNLTASPNGTFTLYAQWSLIPTYTVAGKAEDESHAAVTGATVKLMRGNQVIADTTSDGNGHFAFYNVEPGVYNVVVTAGSAPDIKTVTAIVTLTDCDVTDVVVTMPSGSVNSKLEVTGDDTPAVVVGGLDAEAAQVKSENSSATSVTVTMTVESKAENTAANSTEIKSAAPGKTLEYLDIKLQKTVDGNTTDLSEPTNLLTIVIPFDKGNKQNITVYRYHGNSVDIFKEGASNAVDGEYIEVSDTAIIIYAKKFSTYAIGYTEEGAEPTTPPSAGGSVSYYPITGADMANGCLTISHKNAASGTVITITVSPDEGYELSKLIAVTGNGKAVTLTDKGDGTYSFTMPAAAVTVSASFVKVTTLPFTDIGASHVYRDYIEYVYKHSIMNGRTDTYFDAVSPFTRAHLAVTLYRMAGSPDVSNEILGYPFSDVNAESYSANAIYWARLNGIMEGYDDGTFRPNAPVTRQALVTVLYRYANSLGLDTKVSGDHLPRFPDGGKVALKMVDAVNWAVENGFVGGNTAGLLNPTGSATRGAAAKILAGVHKTYLA